jgi:hypothetical protein
LTLFRERPEPRTDHVNCDLLRRKKVLAAQTEYQ